MPCFMDNPEHIQEAVSPKNCVWNVTASNLQECEGEAGVYFLYFFCLFVCCVFFWITVTRNISINFNIKFNIIVGIAACYANRVSNTFPGGV
jgi:hypothetical protein